MAKTSKTYRRRKTPPPLVREVHPEDRIVGVRELRQNLSVYLERVKRGEALTVTEHGQEIALLRPMPKGGSVLDRLVARGVATAPKRSIRDLPPPLKLKLEKPLSQVLIEMRAEEEY